MKDKEQSKWGRINFFQHAVHHPKVKDCISGKNEDRVIFVLQSLGYELEKDFVRQHPVAERFVLDIAFIKEQVALEVDGEDHKWGKVKKLDRKRDAFLFSNNWISLRIKDEDMFDSYKSSFYKNLIREIVEERRKQWEMGKLYPIDLTEFNENDYE